MVSDIFMFVIFAVFYIFFLLLFIYLLFHLLYNENLGGFYYQYHVFLSSSRFGIGCGNSRDSSHDVGFVTTPPVMGLYIFHAVQLVDSWGTDWDV